MKILIFGKDGQLGKAFQTIFNSKEFSTLHQIEFVGRAQCDLLDSHAINKLLNQCKPDLIINTSAYTAVDKAEMEMDLAYAVNAKAPELMASYAAVNHGTFLHYSTDYVFDGDKTGFYLEEDPRNPLGAYGKSKAAGEIAIEQSFAGVKTSQYAIFRTSWVYGEGGNFIRTILRLAKERDELKVIRDQHGAPTSALWLAQVSLNLVLNATFHLRKFSSGVYHAVPPGETTWHGLASLVVQAAIEQGVALKLKPETIAPILATEYPLPAPRPMNSRMDTRKLQLALEESGDMSKLQHCNRLWSEGVKDYVTQLAKDGLI